jgi:hypothetical protein
MAKVFISYRRSDTGAHADRLAKALRAFSLEVFLDVHDIGFGSDFSDRIRDELSRSHVVLVLIGEGWAGAVNEKTGQLRLSDPTDWVRRETTTAYTLGLLVIPVVFDRAPVLQTHDLPDEMHPIVLAKAYRISTDYFERDANDLGGQIEKELIARKRSLATDAESADAHRPRQGHDSGLENQRIVRLLRNFSIVWFVATLGFATAPAVVPVLPQSLFWLPATMSVVTYTYYLYKKTFPEPLRLRAT